MRDSDRQKNSEEVGQWAWLLPAAFVVHVVEEAFGGDGLMGWMAAGGGVDMSMAEFLGLNLIGAGALCLAAWAARRWRTWRWPLVSGATIFVANGVWHIAICMMSQSYIPGLLTGLVLYVPAGCILLFRLRRLVSPGPYVSAIVAGMMIHGVTLWIVLRLPGFRVG